MLTLQEARLRGDFGQATIDGRMHEEELIHSWDSDLGSKFPRPREFGQIEKFAKPIHFVYVAALVPMNG
ncbi:MAG: hypothetical protein OXH79_14910 [Boseongicola sp.]|nr:hypothetical protein [Boseongicola sp.]